MDRDVIYLNFFFLVIFVIIAILVILIIKEQKEKIRRNKKVEFDNDYFLEYKQKVKKNFKIIFFRKIYHILFIIFLVVLFLFLISLIKVTENKSLILGLTTIFIVVILGFIRKKYSKNYKMLVINDIIKKNYSNFEYYPNKGIEEDEYILGHFESFDKYHSEDLLFGKIDNLPFKFADVITFKEVEIDDKKSDISLFDGIVGVIDILKDVNFTLTISKNKIKIFNNNNRIIIDNELFEGKFDVYASDEIMAMRILTPKFTNILLDIYDKKGLNAEISIIGRRIYFRFHNESMFNPCLFNMRKEAFQVKLCFYLIDGIQEIANETVKIINEVEI